MNGSDHLIYSFSIKFRPLKIRFVYRYNLSQMKKIEEVGELGQRRGGKEGGGGGGGRTRRRRKERKRRRRMKEKRRGRRRRRRRRRMKGKTKRRRKEKIPTLQILNILIGEVLELWTLQYFEDARCEYHFRSMAQTT